MNAEHAAKLRLLTGDTALAAIVLWGSGLFDTAAIAEALHVSEDAVCRTLHMAKDHARLTDRKGRP